MREGCGLRISPEEYGQQAITHGKSRVCWLHRLLSQVGNAAHEAEAEAEAHWAIYGQGTTRASSRTCEMASFRCT